MKSLITGWLGVFALAVFVAAQQPLNLSADKPPAPPSLREVSPGVFEVGRVKLDKSARRVSFPARLNMTNGPLEYLLVTTPGKTHESILATDIAPHHLQVAMLLLGAKGAQAAPLTNAPGGGPITQSNAARNPPLPGEPVVIEVNWTQAGQRMHKRIEELAFNKPAKAAMPKTEFTFTGSRVWQGRFIAQTEGSLIAIVTDPDAVFNCPLPNRDADDTWVVRPADVPPQGTPVEVSITLGPPAKGSPGQGK